MLIKIDYKYPLQSRQAALRVPEPILPAKMFKKNISYLNIFLLEQISKKTLSDEIRP